MRITLTTHTLRLVIVAAAASLALSGCAAAADADTAADTTPQAAGDVVSISDPWVKAADSGMSAAFGELENSGSEDINVVSAESSSSTMLELHETVENDTGEMVMQQKDGGFVIPAGGTFTLEAGGNHIMLMDLVDPLKAGDEATFTLTFSDGSTFEFTAPAKDYTGADENYVGGDMDMDDMDMGTEG